MMAELICCWDNPEAPIDACQPALDIISGCNGVVIIRKDAAAALSQYINCSLFAFTAYGLYQIM